MSQFFDQRASSWDEDPAKTWRAQRVAAAICQQQPLSQQTTVLDYGCGTGLLSFALSPSVGTITAADSSPGMRAVLTAKIAAQPGINIRTSTLDLEHDPIPDTRFDLICSLLTLHHITDTAALLAAFYALLTPGGHLYIADLDLEDGSFHGEGFNGHCGFDRPSLGQLCQQAGFATVNFSQAFEIDKADTHGVMRRYPVFLLAASKAA